MKTNITIAIEQMKSVYSQLAEVHKSVDAIATNLNPDISMDRLDSIRKHIEDAATEFGYLIADNITTEYYLSVVLDS